MLHKIKKDETKSWLGTKLTKTEYYVAITAPILQKMGAELFIAPQNYALVGLFLYLTLLKFSNFYPHSACTIYMPLKII